MVQAIYVQCAAKLLPEETVCLAIGFLAARLTQHLLCRMELTDVSPLFAPPASFN